MTWNTQPATMSIKNAKLRRAGTTVELNVMQEMSVTPMIVSGMLRGSSTIAEANAYIEGAEISFGAGGWPLAALPIMLGITPASVTGSSPNQAQEFPMPAGQYLPYFEAAGRAITADGGDVQIYIPRCKVMSGFQFQIQDGANFVAPSFTANALPDDAGYAFYIIANETTSDITLPTITTVTLTDIDVADNIATATATAHGLVAGQLITVKGATATYINGFKQVISVPTADTFTFIAIGADTTNDSGTATY